MSYARVQGDEESNAGMTQAERGQPIRPNNMPYGPPHHLQPAQTPYAPSATYPVYAQQPPQQGGVDFVNVGIPGYNFSPATQRLARIVRILASLDLLFQVLNMLFYGSIIYLLAIFVDVAGLYGAKNFKRGYIFTYFIGMTLFAMLYALELMFFIGVASGEELDCEEYPECEEIKDNIGALIVGSILSMMVTMISASFSYRLYRHLAAEAYFRAIQAPPVPESTLAMPVHAPGVVPMHPSYAYATQPMAPGAPGYPTFGGTVATLPTQQHPGDPPQKPSHSHTHS